MITGYRTRTSNELKVIADRFKINLDQIGNNAEDVFNAILKHIGSISNEQDRIYVASEVFGNELGARISEMSQNILQFKTATKAYLAAGKQATEILPDVKEYNVALFELTNRWNDFATNLGTKAFPAIQSLISLLDLTVKSVATLYETGKGFVEFFTTGGDSLIKASEKARELLEYSFDIDKKFFGPLGDAISSKLKWVGVSGVNFAQPLTAQSMSPTSGFFGAAPVINLTNEITVPAGTTEEQAQSMADSIRKALDESILNTFKMIQYNNPRTE